MQALLITTGKGNGYLLLPNENKIYCYLDHKQTKEINNVKINYINECIFVNDVLTFNVGFVDYENLNSLK